VRNLEPRRIRWMRLRIGMLAVLLLCGAGAVAQRGYSLMVQRAPALREMAEAQYLRDVRLSPKRGTIYDRNGAELAVSVDVDSVWANPRELRAGGLDPQRVAEGLSRLLGVDAGVVGERLASDRYFVWIKRHVSPQEGLAVRKLSIAGVHTSAESRRFYPNRELAAHVLGFANVDGKGIEGLELTLEDRLHGSADSVPAIRDRRGVVVFSEQLLDDRAAQGDDVSLTIDRTIQRLAERELQFAVRTFEAKAGSVVVMDTRTGEILAMANYPTFNPNDPTGEPSFKRRNRAITDRFEPGSTIKPFTMAGAFALGAVRPNQLIPCDNGTMQIGKRDVIHDTHGWESLTPAQVLAYSSNIGTAKVGIELGKARLYQVLRRFGFGSRTEIALPGETAGILRHYQKWYDLDAATISFGQGMSSTVLQLATAMGALANKGRLMRPLLIKRIGDAHGGTLEEALPEVRRQVVPAHVAQLLSDMLTGVTGPGGTGEEAAIEGYLVAGKTGTAQKADYVRGGYAEDKWSSSFVGYAPADAPRVVTAVVIDEPMIAHYGGHVAGPVFRRVTLGALRQLGVPPDRTAESPVAAKAPKRAKAAPEAAVVEAAAATVEPVAALSEGQVRVPDLLGKTARAALRIAREQELGVLLSGSGVVVQQDPAPSSQAARGSRVTLVLEPPQPRDDQPAEHALNPLNPLKAAPTGGVDG
jgi:cell division protein FtsI (penicillin-binding protein 3)